MNQAKSVKSVKASKQKVKSPSRLVIPERLSFDAITRIQVPEDDEFQSLSLEELTAQVEPTLLAEIERIWTERNNIDSQQGKRSLKFLDRSLANILRW